MNYTREQAENLARSAAMAPLPPDTVAAVLADLMVLHRERARIVELLARLRPAWSGSRAILNELAEIIGDPRDDS